MATPKKPGRNAPLTMRDLATAARWARSLMDWSKIPELAPVVAGVGGDVALQELEHAAAVAEAALPKPRAKAVFRMAMAGRIQSDAIRAVYHQTVYAVHACLPLAAEVLMGKLDDHRAPGSTRVALEMMKGCGVFVPAEPAKAGNRLDDFDLEEARRKDPDALKATILGYS